VANGIYYENLVIDSILTLTGSSMDSTIIDGRGLVDNTISVYADLIFENFNILGKGNGIGDAVIRNFQATNFLEIKNCQISEANIGIGLVNTSIKAENLLMKNLTRGFSLLSANVYNYNISNCIIQVANHNSTGISVGFASQADAFITDNIILFTGTDNPGSGISVGAINEVNIYNNLISGFVRGLYFDTVLDTAFVKNNVLI